MRCSRRWFPAPETGVRDRDCNLRAKSGGGLCLLPGPSIQDWRGVVEFVTAHSQPGDILVVYDDPAPIEYYVARYNRGKESPLQFYAGGVTRTQHAVKVPQAYLAGAGDGANHRVWFTFLVGEAWEHLLSMSHRHSRVTEQPDFEGCGLSPRKGLVKNDPQAKLSRCAANFGGEG